MERGAVVEAMVTGVATMAPIMDVDVGVTEVTGVVTTRVVVIRTTILTTIIATAMTTDRTILEGLNLFVVTEAIIHGRPMGVVGGGEIIEGDVAQAKPRDVFLTSQILLTPMNTPPLISQLQAQIAFWQDVVDRDPDISVGGRLQYFADRWAQIGASPWLIRTLKEGYHPTFLQKPPLTMETHKYDIAVNSPGTAPVVWEHVQEMLIKGAVEPVHELTPSFFSHIFTRPKKTGGTRPIIDLKSLNLHIHCPKFCMETVRSLMASLSQGMWATSTDCQDGYFHIPIHPRFRRYLRFVIFGHVFQFKALAFGLNCAPKIFTETVKVLVAFCHSQRVSIHAYLDDWLVKAFEQGLCRVQTLWLVTLSRYLGWLINFPKSELVPKQDLIYVGVRYDLARGWCFPPPDRVAKILALTSAWLQKTSVTAKQMQELLGLLGSAEKQTMWGRAHLRGLQLCLNSQWKAHSDNPFCRITLSRHAVQDLVWWNTRDNLTAGVQLRVFLPQEVIYTDSSSGGWGAHLRGEFVSGVWSEMDLQNSINWKELMAIYLALVHFLPLLGGKRVLVRTDNSSAVSYVNCQGGTRSVKLTAVALQIVDLAEQNRMSVKARHVVGEKNVLADWLSRQGQILSTEWILHPSVLQDLWGVWGRPQVDLFATRWTNQLPRFISPVPDPQAVGVDALSTSWEGWYGYAYPPTKLIQATLNKVRIHNCVIVLVAPWWPAMSWFTELTDLALEPPIPLPVFRTLLRQPQSQVFHSKPGIFGLHAWKLSREASPRGVIQEGSLTW